jgi:hypothetical protein
MLEGDACFVCGNTDSPQCGHLFGRSRQSTRWDIEPNGNCHIQCHLCNQETSDVSDKAYRDAYVSRFGQEALDALELRANTQCHRLPHELMALLVGFNEMLIEGGWPWRDLN